jgi:hypothetical protein
MKVPAHPRTTERENHGLASSVQRPTSKAPQPRNRAAAHTRRRKSAVSAGPLDGGGNGGAGSVGISLPPSFCSLTPQFRCRDSMNLQTSLRTLDASRDHLCTRPVRLAWWNRVTTCFRPTAKILVFLGEANDCRREPVTPYNAHGVAKNLPARHAAHRPSHRVRNVGCYDSPASQCRNGVKPNRRWYSVETPIAPERAAPFANC